GDSIHRSNVAPIKSYGEPSEWPGLSKRTVKQSALEPSAMQELMVLQNSILHSLFSGSASEELCQTIQPSGQFNELQSLDVYRQSVLARLEEWLLDTFVLLEKLTADAENLQRWVRAFIESHRPIHYNLSEYGSGLAGFLRSQDVDAASLARIVYAQMRLFHRQRPGGGFLSNDSEWNGSSPNPSRWLSATPRALEVWWNSVPRSSDSGRTAPDANVLKNRKREPGSAGLLLYLAGGRVRSVELNRWQAAVHLRLRRGWSLEKALERLASEAPHVDENSVRDFFTFLQSAGLLPANRAQA
ncbi:MAG: putative DNA-binding domain-containing protein, partial [Leptospiraceae bacterium]|nr:putative DNA-binding domain-containing protein [Leptospiraceae bacterium]